MYNKLFFSIFGIFVLVGMIAIPEQCINSAYSSLKLCATAVIPTLLPFFICVKMLSKSGFAKKIGKYLGVVMRPLFNVPGEAAFALVMGTLSGYPMGAKCAVDMLCNNACTKKEAERIVGFCNNSGPLFVIGTVGVTMLGSRSAGLILYISHILSAITVGIILGFKKTPEKVYLKSSTTNDTASILSEAVTESVDLILYVCGYIIFFGVVTALFERFTGVSNGMLTGLIEMTNGISKLSAQNLGILKLPLISFVLGFGGISVILQVIGITEKYNLSKSKFVLAKLMQAVISFIYTSFLINLPISIEVGAFSKQSFSFTGNLICGIALTFISITVLWSISAIIKIIDFCIYKKRQV